MFWNLFESRAKTYLLVVLFSVAAASLLNYAVNFRWYYDGREAERRIDAKRDFYNINLIINTIPKNSTPEKEKNTLETLISKSSGFISVEKLSGDLSLWKLDNGHIVREGRTIVTENEEYFLNGFTYKIEYFYGNAPSYLSALKNGWTWSLSDLIKDSDGYFKGHLYWRSAPLYSCFFILILLTFLLAKELRKKQKLFLALEEESVERVNKGLNKEKENTQRIVMLSQNLIEISSEKSNLEAQLVLKKEDADFLESEALDLENKVAELVHCYDEVIKERSTLEDENNLLKHEMEKIKELISNKFNNMKVENIIEFLNGNTNIATRISSLETVDSESKEFKKLLKIISSYVDLGGGSKVSIPDHGTSHIVREFYKKFDSSFLAMFFCQISSDDYKESYIGNIKVIVNDEVGSGYDGKVNIYIKKGKYGCCISLRFNKKNKVNTANLGYALALILKSRFKFLDEYDIKVA